MAVRQRRFKELREDKPAREVVLEWPATRMAHFGGNVMSTPIDPGSTVTSKLQTFYRGQELGVGTGFFCKLKDQLFLITNWHVVTGRNFETKKCLCMMGGIPDRMQFTAGPSSHIGDWQWIDCNLYEDAGASDQPERPIWLEHSLHRNAVDIVAIPIVLPKGLDVPTIDRVNTVPTLRLTVSRDVFVLGYPKGIGVGSFPIWKRASIATEPNIDIEGKHILLIDTATREGMSGAPVIAIADGEFEVEGPPPAYRPPGRVYRFVGIYSGRLGKNEMEAQLGIVWKPALIEQIVTVAAKGLSSFSLL